MVKEFFEGYNQKNIEYYMKEHTDKKCKKIVLIHDMFEDIDLYIDFIEYFFNQGYDVYVPEIRGNGNLREKEYTDFGEGRIEAVLKDIDIFIHKKFVNVRYNDIILVGQGIGALISYYTFIGNKFNTLILSSLFMENLITINANILLSKIEEKANVKNSRLNKYYYSTSKKYLKEGVHGMITADSNFKKKLREDEKYMISASPAYFNDMLRLCRYVKKNFKNIPDGVNILNIYGGEDIYLNSDKIKKYMIGINSNTRNIRIFKNEKGRRNSLLEVNKDVVYGKINEWLKEVTNE